MGSPLLDEHTNQVLTALGYDPNTIAKMHADHVV
jgi:crotonobetainyl-CoA:carnitine CoA-transferase CaiB-like acyl-CoA transferase